MAKSKCFIIMPVTTPADVADRYNDSDHFEHVLDCLFVPAVEKAKLEPVKPIASGSDLIHGRIIKNLENTDVVLCDMSILNPNVFFELGVRTALNKPVCLVRDNCTPKIPFDLTMINCHEYSGALNHWEVADQIDKLSRHLEASVQGSDGKNTLWQVFGMSSTGEPFEPKGGVEGKLAALTMQIEALRNEVRQPSASAPFGPLLSDVLAKGSLVGMIKAFFATLNHKVTILDYGYEDGKVGVRLYTNESKEVWKQFDSKFSVVLKDSKVQVFFYEKNGNLLKRFP